MKNIKIITLNVQGLVSECKREKVFLWCENQDADVIFLQETHCTKPKQHKFKISWKGKSYYALHDSPFSKGTGILFKEKLDVY